MFERITKYVFMCPLRAGHTGSVWVMSRYGSGLSVCQTWCVLHGIDLYMIYTCRPRYMRHNTGLVSVLPFPPV